LSESPLKKRALLAVSAKDLPGGVQRPALGKGWSKADANQSTDRIDELFQMCLDRGASAAPKGTNVSLEYALPDDVDVLADLPGPLAWPAWVAPPEGSEAPALGGAGAAKSFRRQMREVAFRRGTRGSPDTKDAFASLAQCGGKPADVLKFQTGSLSGTTAHHVDSTQEREEDFDSTWTDTWFGAPAKALLKVRRQLTC
jgi:hypothetical protein